MIKKIPANTPTFQYYNANPKDKRSSDCVLRAIALATGKSWDELLDDLVTYSHKYKEMPNDTKCYSKYLEDLGFIKMSQPRKEDNTKYTGSEFCEWLNKHGKGPRVIVAHIGAQHIAAIVPDINQENKKSRYKIHDTWNCSRRCVGTYWMKYIE